MIQRADGGTFGAAGLRPSRPRRSSRSGHSEHLSHSRKGDRKGVFRIGSLAANSSGAPQKTPMTIAVAGCVAQAEGAEIIKRAPIVDLVIGPQSYHQLPELLARAARTNGEKLATEFTPQEKFDALPKARAATAPLLSSPCRKGATSSARSAWCPTRAAQNIRGRRGPSKTRRAPWSIAGRARNHAAWAERQRLSWHGKLGLADLLARLARIDGLLRLRYTTSHPVEMSDDLIALHGGEAKLMPFLHLPVQSGSDRILKAMNRKHDVRRLSAASSNRLRAARPDIALSTDFIVGFPGESEEDFEATMTARARRRLCRPRFRSNIRRARARRRRR